MLHPETLETTAWTTSTTQCYIPKHLKPQREPQALHSVTSRNTWNNSVNHNHYTMLHPETLETTVWTTTTTQCYIPKHLKPQREPQALHSVTSRNTWNNSVNHNHYTVLHPETLETTVWTTTTTQCYIPKHLKQQCEPQPLHSVTSRNIWNHNVNFKWFITKLLILCEQNSRIT